MNHRGTSACSCGLRFIETSSDGSVMVLMPTRGICLVLQQLFQQAGDGHLIFDDATQLLNVNTCLFHAVSFT